MFPRIIPALAGNTSAGSATNSTTSDHPRSRGEYEFLPCPRGAGAGSSPLSRGIRSVMLFPFFGLGIIPALAGNTRLADNQLPPSRGSSPLSRGIRRDRQVGHVTPRIIPALAGNTRCALVRAV